MTILCLACQHLISGTNLRECADLSCSEFNQLRYFILTLRCLRVPRGHATPWLMDTDLNTGYNWLNATLPSGIHVCDYEEYGVRRQTFRKEISFPSLESKSNQSQKPADACCNKTNQASITCPNLDMVPICFCDTSDSFRSTRYCSPKDRTST
jgi:hypothetical protein